MMVTQSELLGQGFSSFPLGTLIYKPMAFICVFRNCRYMLSHQMLFKVIYFFLSMLLQHPGTKLNPIILGALQTHGERHFLPPKVSSTDGHVKGGAVTKPRGAEGQLQTGNTAEASLGHQSSFGKC